MIYRKRSPSPPRFLLQIAAAAGTGALLGAAACSSSSSPDGAPPMGAVDGSVVDAADDQSATVVGIVGCPGICGVAVAPPDASDLEHDGGAGSDGAPMTPEAADASADARVDAELPCGGGFCGVGVIPPDASSDAPIEDARIVTGIVVHPEE